mmetsp:Transcript_33590/g.56413  ORF Transcript_33590/g.56413 Transcript_33590/m.56413 type:complete len:547 (-) Transcript_33590:368-2008(-)|eukprot:CAMPEP_0198222798 /NCGR_PEP_ID=MMETSP1445-20131203/89639_1 /TAXON_ID=36898 /ORGANISM="Pyramimonas sp., Strain CCMP2087" /LENGTH=546 /DNA_ID=CAMNT_0043901425 /DNA_START=379 /DNA_END=2019 /DNA_ORIENTATION=-
MNTDDNAFWSDEEDEHVQIKYGAGDVRADLASRYGSQPQQISQSQSRPTPAGFGSAHARPTGTNKNPTAVAFVAMPTMNRLPVHTRGGAARVGLTPFDDHLWSTQQVSTPRAQTTIFPPPQPNSLAEVNEDNDVNADNAASRRSQVGGSATSSSDAFFGVNLISHKSRKRGPGVAPPCKPDSRNIEEGRSGRKDQTDQSNQFDKTVPNNVNVLQLAMEESFTSGLESHTRKNTNTQKATTQSRMRRKESAKKAPPSLANKRSKLSSSSSSRGGKGLMFSICEEPIAASSDYRRGESSLVQSQRREEQCQPVTGDWLFDTEANNSTGHPLQPPSNSQGTFGVGQSPARRLQQTLPADDESPLPGGENADDVEGDFEGGNVDHLSEAPMETSQLLVPSVFQLPTDDSPPRAFYAHHQRQNTRDRWFTLAGRLQRVLQAEDKHQHSKGSKGQDASDLVLEIVRQQSESHLIKLLCVDPIRNLHPPQRSESADGPDYKWVVLTAKAARELGQELVAGTKLRIAPPWHEVMIKSQGACAILCVSACSVLTT